MVVAYSVYIGTLDSSELSVGRCFASRTLPPYISIYYPLELQDKLDIQGCVTLLQAHFAAWIIRIGIVFKFLCSICQLVSAIYALQHRVLTLLVSTGRCQA